MDREFYGHTKSDDLGNPLPPSEWQLLKDHQGNTAELAAGFAEPFASADWAWNAGWLHDFGKFAPEFQAYLLRACDMDDSMYETAGGRVNHSTAGAALAMEWQKNAGKILAYLVAGHHAGLPDWHTAQTGDAALVKRLEEGKANLESIRKHAAAILAQLRSVNLPANITPAGCHLWIRMLYSCLTDADFLDTEAFMDPERAAVRPTFPSLVELKQCFDRYMQELTASAEPSPVNVVRQEILGACRRAADNDPGIFTLSVPTGGGKTLSSMAFALDHAMRHGLGRIVYVIPYTSIIEQTSAIFRTVFGEDQVIEHHSNLDPDKETRQSRLASENWDAPIIVTTTVQLFESLYAARSSRCRKLHNLVNSVVILDETQLLPPKWLTPCVDAVNRLAGDYGATVLLSTATQPALPGLATATEIIPDELNLYGRLKRTDIQFPEDLSVQTSWEDLAAELQSHDQVLCIVNTRRDCHDLFELMSDGTIHLSALMCGAHRSKVIAKIKKRLKNKLPVRVISTQLVEAGVDIDFPVVYRALSGLDSINQAAGRCNREGRLEELGRVQVFVPPKLSPQGLLRKAEDATRGRAAAADFDPDSPSEATRFFRLFYGAVNNTGDEWLRDNFITNAGLGEFKFRSAGQEFQMIEQISRPVFIRTGSSEKWLERLRHGGPTRTTMRRLQRYTVNLSRYLFNELLTAGLIEEIHPEFYCWIGKYDKVTGLDAFGAGYAAEDLMI